MMRSHEIVENCDLNATSQKFMRTQRKHRKRDGVAGGDGGDGGQKGAARDGKCNVFEGEREPE
jgi:hypothetical protein